MSEPRCDPSLTNDFSDCDTVERCAWKVLTVACSELNVQAGTFFELDAAGASLRVATTCGVLPWRVAKGQFPLTRGLCGWVCQNREPAMVNDVTQDPRFNGQIDLVTQFKTVSVLCVPVIAADHLFGVIELINRPRQPFTSLDLSRLQALVASASSRLQELSL